MFGRAHGLNAVQQVSDFGKSIVNVSFIHKSQCAGNSLRIEVISRMVNMVAAGNDERVAVDNLFQFRREFIKFQPLTVIL